MRPAAPPAPDAALEAPTAARTYRRAAVFRTQCGDGPRGLRAAALPELTLGEDGSGGAQDSSVFISPANLTGHPLLGFGGSFTEASAVTLQKMGEAEQAEVLQACFDRKAGLGYTLGRVPIGSCDFGLGNWTCGELAEGDQKLSGFSLRRYEEAILPMLRRAADIAEAPLKLLASPWTPPPWMKTKPQFNGDAHLRPECGQVWALHYAKFVQEMRRLGVPIWAVSVQNEPEAAMTWEACIYTAEEERDFVRDHLGPTLEGEGLGDVKILVWDHNRDGMLERAAVAYSDPEAAKYIWGVGYHWYGDARYESWPERTEVPFADRQRNDAQIFELRARVGFDNVRRVAELRPDKHILFTEGCQELGGRPLSALLGSWKVGERYAMNIIADLNSGCEGWIDWNLLLDETGGPNHVGNLCSAPIICDTKTNTILYQISYWYMLHFSRWIRPGARRALCASSRDVLEITAWVNLDGSLSVVVMNQGGEAIDFWLKVAGSGAARTQAPARSITTFVLTGD